MVAGLGSVPARRPRTRALFQVSQPNSLHDTCAGQALASRQGDEGLQHRHARVGLPLLLLPLLLLMVTCSGTVWAADTGLSGDDGNAHALPPAAADSSSPPSAWWSWRISRDTLPALAASSLGGLPAAGTGRVVQTMAWWDRPAVQWGLGVEQRWTLPGTPGSATPGMTDAGLLVGLRLDAGPRAHLTWQAPLGRADTQYGEVQPRQMRVALSLLPQDPYADLRRGLLTKVELSGQTTLALRPRGGRLGVLLTSHW